MFTNTSLVDKIREDETYRACGQGMKYIFLFGKPEENLY